MAIATDSSQKQAHHSLKIAIRPLGFQVCRKLFCHVIQYRVGMRIRKIMLFPTAEGETGYYLCPRCQILLEREFVAYCDCCGQRLNWDHYESAQEIRAKIRRPYV